MREPTWENTHQNPRSPASGNVIRWCVSYPWFLPFLVKVVPQCRRGGLWDLVYLKAHLITSSLSPKSLISVLALDSGRAAKSYMGSSPGSMVASSKPSSSTSSLSLDFRRVSTCAGNRTTLPQTTVLCFLLMWSLMRSRDLCWKSHEGRSKQISKPVGKFLTHAPKHSPEAVGRVSKLEQLWDVND